MAYFNCDVCNLHSLQSCRPMLCSVQQARVRMSHCLLFIILAAPFSSCHFVPNIPDLFLTFPLFSDELSPPLPLPANPPPIPPHATLFASLSFIFSSSCGGPRGCVNARECVWILLAGAERERCRLVCVCACLGLDHATANCWARDKTLRPFRKSLNEDVDHLAFWLLISDWAPNFSAGSCVIRSNHNSPYPRKLSHRFIRLMRWGVGGAVTTKLFKKMQSKSFSVQA